MSEAARVFGKSRQTIYNALRDAGLSDIKDAKGNLTDDAIAALAARFPKQSSDGSLTVDTPTDCQVSSEIDTTLHPHSPRLDSAECPFDTTDCQLDTQECPTESTPGRDGVKPGGQIDTPTGQVDTEVDSPTVQIDTTVDSPTGQVDTQIDTPTGPLDTQVDRSGLQVDSQVDTQADASDLEKTVEVLREQLHQVEKERDTLAARLNDAEARIAEQAAHIATLSDALRSAQEATTHAQAIAAATIASYQQPMLTDGTDGHRRTVWERISSIFRRRKDSEQ